jgi:hypothetical protein
MRQKQHKNPPKTKKIRRGSANSVKSRQRLDQPKPIQKLNSAKNWNKKVLGFPTPFQSKSQAAH